MTTWIVNASPLILLGKIDRISLLPALADVIVVPRSVADEIVAGPANDPARAWLNFAGRGWVSAPIPSDARIVAWDLGGGETAVITHALRAKGAYCVLDDRAARDCAAVFGLPVLGSLGVLLRAKRAKLLPAVRPELDALLRSGALLSASVIRECLELADERA